MRKIDSGGNNNKKEVQDLVRKLFVGALNPTKKGSTGPNQKIICGALFLQKKKGSAGPNQKINRALYSTKKEV